MADRQRLEKLLQQHTAAAEAIRLTLTLLDSDERQTKASTHNGTINAALQLERRRRKPTGRPPGAKREQPLWHDIQRHLTTHGPTSAHNLGVALQAPTTSIVSALRVHVETFGSNGNGMWSLIAPPAQPKRKHYNALIQKQRAKTAQMLEQFSPTEPRRARQLVGSLVRRGYLRSTGREGKRKLFVRTEKPFYVSGRPE